MPAEHTKGIRPSTRENSPLPPLLKGGGWGGVAAAEAEGRGLQQLQNPDVDANECWEGPDWTSGLTVDCVFRTAGCLAKMGRRDQAVGTYGLFLSLIDLGLQGIYSRKDALKKLNQLLPNKKTRREAAVKSIGKVELIP